MLRKHTCSLEVSPHKANDKSKDMTLGLLIIIFPMSIQYNQQMNLKHLEEKVKHTQKKIKVEIHVNNIIVFRNYILS